MMAKRDYRTVDDLSPAERAALRERVESYKATGRMGSRVLPPVTVRKFVLPFGVARKAK